MSPVTPGLTPLLQSNSDAMLLCAPMSARCPAKCKVLPYTGSAWKQQYLFLLYTCPMVHCLQLWNIENNSNDQYRKHLKLNHTFCCHFSVAKSCPTLCDPMDCSTPGSSVLHYLLEFPQVHVHWVGDAIQPSHLLSSPSPSAFNLSQHQGLLQWVSSLHLVAKLLKLQHYTSGCLALGVRTRVGSDG